MTTETSNHERPLAGVRVLDLTRVLSGPFCTALMADLGADVIKIESPSGDDYRHVPPFTNGQSAFFLLVNRGKKSVAINLKSDAGKELARDLVAKSDVVVENFKPGVAARLGLDYEACRAIREDIIYASISGFGQDGPMADQPAYDIIVQAASGIMQSTGFAENPPTLVGEAMADLVAGLFASWSISSALYEREKTGRGRNIDVAMFDCLFSMLPTSIAQWSYGGHLPNRTGNRHPISVPFGTFRAKDGFFVLGILNDNLFHRFLEIIGQQDLITDPRVAGDDARSANEPLVRQMIEQWAADKSVEQVLAGLSREKIPVGPIWTIEQAINSEQVKYRQLLATVEHSQAGEIQVMEQPVKFAGLSRGNPGSPPLFGEHTLDVLSDLCGVSAARLQELESEGVIITDETD
jgi:CoA:oxalate CoA-transferase